MDQVPQGLSQGHLSDVLSYQKSLSSTSRTGVVISGEFLAFLELPICSQYLEQVLPSLFV